MLDVERLAVVTCTTTSSSLVVDEHELTGITVDPAVTVTHAQFNVELLTVGWMCCATNCCHSFSEDHGTGHGNACCEMAAIGDNINVVEPVSILKSVVTNRLKNVDEFDVG